MLMQDDKSLREIRSFLTAITGRILQLSDHKAGVALGAATSTLAGTTAASTIMGIVGTLGSASTGTALASLAGAAKTSATLYWIGGIAGGGAAAGAVIVGAGAIGAGIYGSRKVRRALLGQTRRDTLSEREQEVVLAITTLVQAIDETLASRRELARRELELFSRIGITPLREAVQKRLADGAFSELTTYNRVRLRGHLNNLEALQGRLAL